MDTSVLVFFCVISRVFHCVNMSFGNKKNTFYRHSNIHLALVLRPSCVPEKLGVKKRGLNRKWCFNQKWGVSVTGHSQPKDVKPKMRERVLSSNVHGQEALGQMSVEERLTVLHISPFSLGFSQEIYILWCGWIHILNEAAMFVPTYRRMYVLRIENKGKVILLQARCGPEGG